jgi:hypothetical protein
MKGKLGGLLTDSKQKLADSKQKLQKSKLLNESKAAAKHLLAGNTDNRRSSIALLWYLAYYRFIWKLQQSELSSEAMAAAKHLLDGTRQNAAKETQAARTQPVSCT